MNVHPENPQKRTVTDCWNHWLMRGILVLSLIAFATSCLRWGKCPQCPEPEPAPPPKIVKLHQSCMDAFEPPVSLDELAKAWPEPNQDETTTLSPKMVGQLLVFLGYLRGYLESNLSRCQP